LLTEQCPGPLKLLSNYAVNQIPLKYPMQVKTEVLIIGGGLAGLTAALHLQKAGIDVLLIEKNTYPNHKVCGEYISNEVLPYLKWLDADPEILGPSKIDKLLLSVVSGKSITTELPLGGFGISRYTLDNFLYHKLKNKGGRILHDTVTSVEQRDDQSTIFTQQETEITAIRVIAAYGKRSALDIKLKRPFIQKKSPFLAVKAHYSGQIPADLVALHNFRGGYCGISQVEDQKINVCYLADFRSFSKHKNILSYQQEVLYENPNLREFFESSQLLFDSPITISQLAFGSKETVSDHMVMIGDSAGLIHPLCGNGMAIAIHSAKICAELLILFFSGKIKTRETVERLYTLTWNSEFKSRLKMGSILSALLSREQLANMLLKGLLFIPPALPFIIKRTHGKTLTPNL